MALLVRGVRRKVGLLMGFDLEAKAAAGLDSPPGADLLDVINVGMWGRREAWGLAWKP